MLDTEAIVNITGSNVDEDDVSEELAGTTLVRIVVDMGAGTTEEAEGIDDLPLTPSTYLKCGNGRGSTIVVVAASQRKNSTTASSAYRIQYRPSQMVSASFRQSGRGHCSEQRKLPGVPGLMDVAVSTRDTVWCAQIIHVDNACHAREARSTSSN